MSELKAFEVNGKSLFGRTYVRKVYLKSEADEVIDEKDRVIAELKKKLEDTISSASITCEAVRRRNEEIRRLRKALYKACANWADVVAFGETEGIGYDNSVAERWRKMERKCLKKTEEYK